MAAMGGAARHMSPQPPPQVRSKTCPVYAKISLQPIYGGVAQRESTCFASIPASTVYLLSYEPERNAFSYTLSFGLLQPPSCGGFPRIAHELCLEGLQ